MASRAAKNFIYRARGLTKLVGAIAKKATSPWRNALKREREGRKAKIEKFKQDSGYYQSRAFRDR